MYTELVRFLFESTIHGLKTILDILRSFFTSSTPNNTKECAETAPNSEDPGQARRLSPQKLTAMSQEMNNASPKQELTVILSLGHEKRPLTVTRGTTVEELANMVFLEVLNEAPPSTGPALGSAFRLVFRGRQLMTPDLTMGALRVKNGEKIMVLMNQSHRNTPSTTAENSSQSSTNATQASRAPSHENADQNSKGAASEKAIPQTPSARIEALKDKAEHLLSEVQPLSEGIKSAVARGTLRSGEWTLSDLVKRVHLCNVELMHVLEDLADISLVHLKDSEELRKRRKAIVDHIVENQNSLDAVISSGKKALGK